MADQKDKQNLIVKFPKVEGLPMDPPIAGQNLGLFSFKLFPKPVNGTFGFLKFRGAFATQSEAEAHAENIIRTIDSQHHIWPYQQGRWMPITTNEEFAGEVLEVGQQKELNNIFKNKESDDQKQQKQAVKDIKSREKKLMDEMKRREPDTSSLEYYAQQIMKTQQLESWLEQMRQRKRSMLKALHSGKDEIDRLDKEHPEYRDKVDEKIQSIKKEIGLDENAPIDKPSIIPSE